MPVLYHYPLSAPSRFIRLILNEYKIDAEYRKHEPWQYDETILKLNPAGNLPVFDDAAKGLFCGARVISEWLEETHEGAYLLPGTPEDRAEVRRLLDWFDDKFTKEVGRPIFAERVTKRYQKGQAVSSDILRAAIGNGHIHLEYFDWMLGQHDWLAGDVMTLADFQAAAHLSVLDYFGDLSWDKYGDLKSWYMKMKSRPSFRPLLADRLVGMAPAPHYANLDF